MSMHKLLVRAATLLAAVPLLGLALAGAPVAAQTAAADYPSRPITIVVTFPPGGGTDLLARRLGEVLKRSWGQPVVVENRPGASGNIGASQVARAAPDGYTLLMVNSSFAINPGVFEALDFSPARDFSAVINVGFVPSVLVVPAASPWRALPEVFAAARGNPATPLLYASCGPGTPQHLAGEMLAQAIHAPFTQVPYKGCGPALADVVSGQVALGIVTASSAMPLIQAGKLRALGVTSLLPTAQLPEVPTVAEQGIAGYELDQWHGLLAPAGTPPAVVARLNGVLAQALQSGELVEGLRALGYQLTRAEQRTPQAFQALLLRDLKRFAALATERGLRLDAGS